jgi:hypothetical protein
MHVVYHSSVFPVAELNLPYSFLVSSSCNRPFALSYEDIGDREHASSRWTSYELEDSPIAYTEYSPDTNNTLPPSERSILLGTSTEAKRA